MKLALNGCSFLQNTVRLSLQRDRTYNPHPCTVLTAAHNIHTRPPEAPARLAYQRTLMNPYCMFYPVDLASERIGALSRSHAAGPASTSLVSDAKTCPTRKTLRPLQQPVVAPALAGALVARTIADVLGIAAILLHHLTILAGLAVLSRSTKISLVTSSASFCSSASNSGGCSRVAHLAVLVTEAEAAIDDAKERAWMDTYETDHDTLEDVLYRRLESLWAPFTDALRVFQKHNASQPRCAQKVWEALLTAFPLDHKRMQTALLARELARMMRWDGDTTRAINLHFSSITELHHTLNFIGELSMEDVLQSVLLATLRASPNASLRAAYHTVIDSVDEGKDLNFALIQDHCASESRRSMREP